MSLASAPMHGTTKHDALPARTLLKLLADLLRGCSSPDDQHVAEDAVTTLAAVLEALAKQLRLQSSFQLYSSLSTQLRDWDQQERLRACVLDGLHAWLSRPLGFDLLVQATSHQSATRLAVYEQLWILLQSQLHSHAPLQTAHHAGTEAVQLEGLGQQVSSELQRLVYSEGGQLARLDLEAHLPVLLRLHVLLHPCTRSSSCTTAVDAASSSAAVPQPASTPPLSAGALCTAPSELAMLMLAAVRHPSGLQSSLATGAAEAHGQAGGPHVSQPAVARQLIETFMQILMAQPEVLGLEAAAAVEALDDLLVLHERISAADGAGRSPSLQPDSRAELACASALQLAELVHGSLKLPDSGIGHRPRAHISYSDKGRQSTRPAPRMHQAHQPRTVASMLHTLRSCILLQGWDGDSAQSAKALRLAFDMCTLSAQGPQAGLSYSKGSAAQVIDLAAGSTTPAVSHVPATGHSEGLSSSVRANKRQKVSHPGPASKEPTATDGDAPVTPQAAAPAGAEGGKRRINAEPVSLHASEPHGSQPVKDEPAADADEGDGEPGLVMSSWSDLDGRGDAAAAEEYWEDYLRGKMDLVCSILQEGDPDQEPPDPGSPSPACPNAGSPDKAAQSPKLTAQQMEGSWASMHAAAVHLMHTVLVRWPGSADGTTCSDSAPATAAREAVAALQLLVSRSLSAALAKEVSKCANRIGASHLGNSLWTLLSGKRQACGGVSLLYLAAQLLRGLRIPGQQATPAELRIRLTMAFLPLLCCLGDAVAQHSTPLSAGDGQALFLVGELLEAMLLRRLVPLTNLPPEGVRHLLRLVLLCQAAQHVLPVATGILWAVAQGRFAPLESLPPACLRVMRPHTAAMWQALGDTQARRAAMTTLLSYAAQQLPSLAAALPGSTASQTDAAAGSAASGATAIAQSVQPMSDAITAICDAVLCEAPGGIRGHTICTSELLELLLPLAAQLLHLCAEGARALAAQLSISSLAEAAIRTRSQSVSLPESMPQVPGPQQAVPDTALRDGGSPQPDQHGSAPDARGQDDQHEQQQQHWEKQQDQHPKQAKLQPTTSSDCSWMHADSPAAEPRPLRRIRRSGDSAPAAGLSGLSVAAPASPACQSADTAGRPWFDVDAGAPAEQQRSSSQGRSSQGAYRDPRLKAMLQAAAEALAGEFRSSPSVVDRAPPATPSPCPDTDAGAEAKPPTTSSGLQSQSAALQYDEAAMSDLAVLHTAGLTLALAGQQLLTWRERCRTQEHPALFQALQKAVQQMQSRRLLPASVAQAMRQLLQQQHGKVQVSRRTALDHARDQHARAAELQSAERQGTAAASPSSGSESEYSGSDSSEDEGQSAEHAGAGTAGHRGRSSNAFVKAALAEGGARDRDEDLDDLDDFIVCQAERDYSSLFSSDFRFAMQ